MLIESNLVKKMVIQRSLIKRSLKTNMYFQNIQNLYDNN